MDSQERGRPAKTAHNNSSCEAPIVSHPPRLAHMPLFVGDFLASTATWTGEERGLYLLLLAMQWAAGALPAAASDVARSAGYDCKKFATLWRRVGQKFNATDVGLANSRLEEHRRRSLEIATTNRDRAKRAADARYGRPRSSRTNGAILGALLGALVGAAPVLLGACDPYHSSLLEACQEQKLGLLEGLLLRPPVARSCEVGCEVIP